MEKIITIQRNKVFFSILLSIFLFSAFFLNYLNVSAADCGGCGQPACPVTPPPTSPPHTSPPLSQNRCTCSVRYSNTPCADTCRTNEECGDNDNDNGNGGNGSHYAPPTSPPPTCQIMSFTINDKDNSDQNPLIVWVNALLKGYFSVNDVCISCEVTSNNNWNKTYDPLPLSGNVTEQFKINTAGTYSYILECVGTDPEDIAIDALSLQTIKAINLPWWREIIPNLGGFLKGL